MDAGLAEDPNWRLDMTQLRDGGWTPAGMKDLAKLKGKMSETGLSSVVGIKVSPSTLQSVNRR